MDKEIKKLTCELTKHLKGKHKTTEALRHLELENFTFLASGLSRVCFVHKSGKYVLKIEKGYSMKRYKQNMREVKNYKRVPEKLKKHFVKPLAYAKNFSWVLTTKVQTEEDDVPNSEISKTIRHLYKIFDEAKLNVTDIHSSNVGILNNEPVMLDYGYDLITKSK